MYLEQGHIYFVMACFDEQMNIKGINIYTENDGGISVNWSFSLHVFHALCEDVLQTAENSAKD